MVTTFIGRDQTKSVEQNLELVKEVWPPIIALAEELGVDCHRKLSHAVRRGSVAGRSEPHDHAADLAQGF